MNLPAPGIILQIYLGGLRRASDLPPLVHQAKLAGCSGIAFHGGPRGLVGAWDGYATLAHNEGLAAWAAWGLDGTRDNDGTVLTAAEKGACLGAVLAKNSCAVGLLDAEGKWDAGGTDPTGTTEAGSLALGESLRKAAPNACVGDQCWWDPEQHGDYRRVPKPIGQGGPLSGFPFDEFAAKGVNYMHFRQGYCNNAQTVQSLGAKRYEWMWTRMEASWARIQTALRPMGLERPLGVTIQAYNWEPNDAVHVMLTEIHTKSQPIVAWYESKLYDADFWQEMRAVKFLADRGFATPGATPETIVQRYQAAYNTTAITKLTVDGKCGPNTLRSMGLAVG